MKTCLIRTDASLSIGTGHVMRCLTLAKYLKHFDYCIVFVCVDYPGQMALQIESAGFDCILLNVDDAFQPIAIERVMPWPKADLLIIDHYQIDATWESAVSHNFHFTMAIDDLANRTHCVDLLLDQNLGREAIDYESKLPQTSQCLIGPEFALLRDEFVIHRESSIRRRQSPTLRGILISFGGVDQFNVSTHALEIVSNMKLPDLKKIDIVVGTNFPHLNALRAQCNHYSGIINIHVGAHNMAELMRSADLAIGAAGGTAWERCALGLPSIVVVIAENQIPGALALEQSGAALVIERLDQMPQQLPVLLSRCLSMAELADMSRKAQNLVDALGVERVVQVIMKQGVLRSMQPRDLRQVLEWRNRPEVRRHMFNQDQISFEEHLQWFLRGKANDHKILMVYEIKGQLQGFVQFDIEPGAESATWGFYKNPFAASGVGSMLCRAALRYAFRSLFLKTIKASVLISNQVSIRFHQRLGFVEIDPIENTRNFVLHRSMWREQEGSEA